MKKYIKTRHRLPQQFYSVAQAFSIDSQAKQGDVVKGYHLMLKAGQSAFDCLRQQFPKAGTIAIFCGYGNNGGDGLVVAQLAMLSGLKVDVYMLGTEPRFTHEAAMAYKDYQGELKCWESKVSLAQYDVIVDAILGIGFKGGLSSIITSVIVAINRSNIPVIALDVPSGVYADNGAVATVAIKAHTTITFIVIKQGLLTGQAVNHVGLLYYDDLGVITDLRPSAIGFELFSMANEIPRYQPTVHKGSRGHVFCIGGMNGMLGALILSAESAFAIGAGKVSVINDGQSIFLLLVRTPEVMHKSTAELTQANAMAIGMGLGVDKFAQDILQMILDNHYKTPMVLDADALNLISSHRVNFRNLRIRDNIILTPHPLEAARLLGVSVDEIEQDRFSAVKRLHEIYGAVIVLKGAGTLIYNGHEMYLCQYGNPYMGVAGMGDALSGVIAGLLAQGLDTTNAARLGVFIHAYSADQFVLEKGGFGLSASRLIAEMSKQMNAILGLIE